ncbi:MAG TPA: hypothetical protein VKZ79_05025 [Alphaproteobacteria bacterium]|nr:hypothetical protein [Alphaproteobacteria bacterium]
MNRKALALLACFGATLVSLPSALAGVRIEGELIVPPVVVAPGAPPPLRPEVVPPPPGPPEAMVWAPGHWEWNGRTYFWVGGHYVERPEVGLVWEPGRWIDRHGHWEWVGGHWRR